MIQTDPDVQRFELQLSVEELNSRERVEMYQIDSDLEIAKLKVKTSEKRKMRERVLLGVVKAPALVIFAILVPIIVLAKREVPEQILNFLSL